MSVETDFEVPYPRFGSEFGDEELEVLRDLLTSEKGLSQGPWRDRFEAGFREHVGSAHAYAVTSGTVALQLAVNLLDLRPGDEVIAVPQTYQATIQPLLALQVDVRFCDIDRNSLNIDVDQLETMITERTRAVLLVHYGGLPAEMNRVMELSRRHGFLVVEDAAHALGAEYCGRPPGSLADIACFSFHSTKNITTLGEGGMITFDRDEWAERVLRWRGNECDGDYRVTEPGRKTLKEVPHALYPGLAYTHDCAGIRHVGTNATLSEPASAIGLIQLGKLPMLTARRTWTAHQLDRTLKGLPGVRVQSVPPDVRHAYHLYTFFVDRGAGIDRDAVVAKLRELGVESWLRYFPLHLLPEWRARGHLPGECPVAEKIWFEQQINLPCQPTLTDVQVKRMRGALEEVLLSATG
ncbi:aminotransferase DegT [Streptomyces sp. PRh5]|uniref:DegT/DnrJ/EryC1/StrS family aminotransferase n=1 Tax=Streptomyces sp. PRh5 TaxID=1158056 RepID=UPI00044507C8|nr:DegT/DnrJ/EryC1/StrS family aminotransferase [Streptomyces sp. PRh5]EXU64838.1 aminotransferase DegT [Streptomyces sp. PRh5]